MAAPITNNTTNRIDTLAELQDQIKQVKTRVKHREQDLQDRWKRLPEEAVKGTIGRIVPSFLNTRMTGVIWKLASQALGLAISNKIAGDKKGSWKDLFTGGPAKQLGVFTALKLAFNLFSKKKKDKENESKENNT